ncbi:CLUMA_CG014566, isoform A [Clunio marinus]|uniref:CLUMA_CG014566, isoform A n=1 Tax=Clunio marinus TaxID=568069 RepID=A0A1J1IMR5_9DIPT|nr:CLUMA_CG014566, isoform A [Clunio marinus]
MKILCTVEKPDEETPTNVGKAYMMIRKYKEQSCDVFRLLFHHHTQVQPSILSSYTSLSENILSENPLRNQFIVESFSTSSSSSTYSLIHLNVVLNTNTISNTNKLRS